MMTHILVTCHRCGNTWAYMGSKVMVIERGEGKNLRVRCHCGANTKLVKDKTIASFKT